MSQKTYSFVEQLDIGEQYEDVLDEYFGQWYEIAEVDINQQRKGIDRIFTGKSGGDSKTIEYKADEKTQDTGNVFIETWSVMEMGKYGWAWTCQADMLIYLAIPDTIYMIQPIKVRESIPKWEKRYGLKTVKNKHYTSAGITVPIGVFELSCDAVRRLV